jgi:hypothetical protein
MRRRFLKAPVPSPREAGRASPVPSPREAGRASPVPSPREAERASPVPSPREAGRGLGRGVCLAAGFLLLATAACEEVSHRDIGDEINILVRRDDALVPPAIDRLAHYRRFAIPQIETAMHTAAPAGRHHLIAALEMIGDDEAVPILRHVAVFDITADVRGAAENLLSRWAAATDGKARAARAQAALAEIARKRAAGIGPMMFGANGIPGVPSTIGTPELLGADTK